MSQSKKASSRSPLPLVVFILVCAGLGAVLVVQQRGRSRPKDSASPQVIARSAEVDPKTNNSFALMVTNQPAPQTEEDQVVALSVEGNQLIAQGKYAEGAQRFEQAIALSPDQEDLHFNLGIAYARQGKKEDAKSQYQEALRIYPEYGDAHNNLGNLLVSENKLDEAVEQFREAIKTAPENASFHNNLGTALARQGNMREALGEFEEATRRNTNYVEARVNLASALLTGGRAAEAIPQLEEALRLKPDFKPALQVMQRARLQNNSNGPAK